jgi:hypothetical protein
MQMAKLLFPIFYLAVVTTATWAQVAKPEPHLNATAKQVVVKTTNSNCQKLAQ